ncbi:hypothetical protein N9383_04795 [Granulosicoccus sp.]|nr:hypothetical protein [Granulosicoccus sp.]
MSHKEVPESKPLAGIYPALLTGFSVAAARRAANGSGTHRLLPEVGRNNRPAPDRL